MQDGCISKDLLYGELAFGRIPTGWPQLRYCDVNKRDMKATNMNTESWESLTDDRSKWRGALTQHLKAGEEKLMNAAAEN